MSIYDHLGVVRVINAVGPATRLGGLGVSAEVWDAMREALESSVRISELQVAAGRRLAELLGVEACYVTSGAAAALTMATAVAMTGTDCGLVDQLPDTSGMRNKVIIQQAQRDPYDRAIMAAGAQMVAIGYPHTTHASELTRAIDESTAAVFFRPGAQGNLLSLKQMADIAHAHGVPVIVDGALCVPPVENLQRLFDDGADLVAISGGKKFRGPQASGILSGRPDLISAVRLHHQDMDEREESWIDPTSESMWSTQAPPRHGIARGMKVGREQIVGLVAAVERYVNAPDADDAEGLGELAAIEEGLAELPDVLVTRRLEEALDVDVLDVELGASGLEIDTVIRELATGNPRIAVGEQLAWRDTLVLNPMALRQGDGAKIVARFGEVLERG